MFEPSPILFAFIFVQRFVFFEVLGVLALLRLIVGRGWARVPAFAACVICALFVFVTFAPALNLHVSALYLAAAPILVAQGGVLLPLLTSLLFASGMLFPERRWRWIDVANIVALLAFLALWLATRF